MRLQELRPSCTVLALAVRFAARKALRQRILGTFCVCMCSFSFDPQPLRQGMGIAGCIRASSDAADTRGDAPKPDQEQPDDAGRINDGRDRDGSREPPQLHYGGFAPTFVCQLGLGAGNTCRHDASSATKAGPLIFVGTAAQHQARQAITATARWAAIIASSRYLVWADLRSSKPALPDISMSSLWAKSHAVRSGSALAGAADGGPAIHRCKIPDSFDHRL